MKRLFFVMFLALVFGAAAYSQGSDVRGRVFWRGMIDDKVQLRIQADKIETVTISGRAYPDGIYSFTSPLPSESVMVDLIKKAGRGTARVVQQPTEENNFAAIIEIYDNKGGAKEYQLEIFWR